MKQFLQASPLRRLAPVALALGFAFWAPPARAILIEGTDSVTLEVGESRTFSFFCEEEEVEKPDGSARKSTVTVSASPAGLVAITTMRDGMESTDTRISMVDSNGSPNYDGSFVLQGTKAGTTTVTLTVRQGATQISTASFQVTVEDAAVNIQFRDEGGNVLETRFVSLGEGDVRTIQVTPVQDYTVACPSTDVDDHLAYNPMTGAISLRGLDGLWNGSLNFTDPSGNLDPTTLTVLVTNKPPKLAGSSDPLAPTPWGWTLKTRETELKATSFGPSDPAAADYANLKLTWSLSGEEIGIDGAFTNTWMTATEDGEPEVFSVTVTDGNDSYTGYFSITVRDTVTLLTDTTSPLTALTREGGIAQDTSFLVFSESGALLDWVQIDGRVYKSLASPNEILTLRAVLEPNSYLFGWFSEHDYDAFQTPSLRVPNSSINATIRMPDEGSVTIQYLASYPYYHTEPGKGAANGLNTAWTDPFGDFDADGLSDVWEDHYFQDGLTMNITGPGSAVDYPVGQGNGDFGQEGNLDGDWLPTKVEELAPDGNNKAGWPVVRGDQTNRVFVLKYPLDFSSGDESYYKGDRAEKPTFDNFIEYRGLREDRVGDGTDPDTIVRYAPDLVDRNTRRTVDGENCAGTHPGKANDNNDPKTGYDTDGDTFSDGWEWYFWTTIKYGVHSENWRCWDPTYTYYSTASAQAGFPMIETDDPLAFDFDVEPTQSYDIDPNAGTYRTYYEVTKKILSDNDVVLPIVPGTVSFTFDGSEFALFTLSRALANYLGLNPKDQDGNDRLFYMLYADTDNDGVPDSVIVNPNTGYPELRAVDGARVNDLTGQMYVPGWQTLVQLEGAVAFDVTQDTVVHVAFERQNGLFPKQFLLSRFDPMNWDEYTASDIPARIAAAGFNPDNWDPLSDLDGDGVSDMEEYFLGTDPLHWDTDRDGMPDGWEVQRGLLPTDPRNHPGGFGAGPGDNPDQDYMAYDATGTAIHADAYRADLANEVYWNGKTFVGYRPGRAALPSGPTSFQMHYEQGLRTVDLTVMTAFGGGPFSNLQEFLYSYYGVTHGFWAEVYPNVGDTTWATTTTDPCNNDTDGDGLPDGWEPYVGYSPLAGPGDGDLMEGIGYEFDPFGYLEQPPVCQGPTFNPDLDYDQDYPESDDLIREFCCLWVNQLWPETVTNYIEGWTWNPDVDHRTRVNPNEAGTPVVIHGFPAYDGWYNKWMPTDPWNADTDGDGLTDFQEYIDLADGNGDGEPKCNFNPTQVDTDMDWLPDGWERFMNLYSYQQLPNQDAAFIDDEYGPFGDPDGDKLANYQEYLTGANYGWRHDKWYPLDKENMWVPQARTPDETEKWNANDPWDFPYDPGLYPQYGPTVRAHVYSPVDFFSVPVSGTTIGRGMEALKTLEKRWKYTVAESPSIEMETLAARYQRVYELIYNYTAARDIPVADGNPERDEFASLFLYDTDPSYDPDYNSDGETIPGKKYWHHHSKAEHDAIVALYEGVLPWIYSYAQCGYGWDLSGALVNLGVYMPLNGNSTGYGFPGTRPLSVDSDNDGMPDYWEIYHGLNPTYGGARLLAKAGDLPDGDRADKDSWGDGSTDNWIMGCDPTYVLNLNFAMRSPYAWPIARKAKTGWAQDPDGEWVGYSFDDAITTAFGPDMMGNYIMEWSHYDLVNRPWLSGDKSADCDKDGLNNQEEAYSFFANDLWSHTDPSPYWLTDISQTVGYFGQNASHVNLYYQAADYGAALIWWWAVPFNGGVAESPQYVWDFETNEGFDTDNDNIGDREEMASVSSRGKTDPQNFDSPISRKAMYFDGHAACRTQRPFFHDQYALTSHTVEFWVRPHAYPAPGRIATFVHRPVMMPVDTLSGSKAWEIRNTFHLYMDELGRVFGQVDNDGVEQAANSAVVMSSGRLVLDKWAHIAMVMDSQNDDLALYINGEFAGHVACSLKPCTGVIMSSSYREWLTSSGGGSNGLSTASTTSVNFDWSPAPIVVGAYEKNPWGVVGGKLWNLTETQFDEHRFFDGWIDEIRIWDRCRSQTQIMNNMTKRFKPSDIEPINRKRWVWDKDHLYATDAEADFPQKVLYHYSFDNMPDVKRDPGRNDATAFFTDTDPVPLGWSVNESIRPVPFVPWWYLADNRTTVYATDFSYVPFVENTVSHLAQRPSRDISEIVPVYNPVDSNNSDNNWRFLGYRYRRSSDWATENQAAIEIGGWQYVEFLYYPTNVLGGLGPTDISYYANREDSGLIPESLLINTMNPYGDGYNTHVRGTFEYNPWNFGGELDRYGVYEGVPIHSDMVPLLDAVADIDVPLWDGAGEGWDNAAIDTDGDGLPDWWEIAIGLDPNDASGFNGAYGDRDNDGLDNWAEYLAGTSPFSFDTDSDGYSDYYSRPDGRSLTFGELYDDGDGMDNAWEIENGLDPNRFDANDDLDGDGWTNWEEYMAHQAWLAYQAHPEDFERPLANADPTQADTFPEPWFNVTFFYDGERIKDSTGISATPYVRSYGEKTAGRTMGGSFDGMYDPTRVQRDFPSPDYNVRVSVANTEIVFGEVWQLGGYPVGGNTAVSLTTGSGAAALMSATPYEHDANYGLFYEDTKTHTIALLRYSTGQVLLKGNVQFGGYAEYSVGGRTFPYTARGLSRMGGEDNRDLLPYGWTQFLGGHDHMVSGWNRFMGFLDLDNDRRWTPGEPMGLSQPRPTLVNWDSVETTIPLTDSVWDFPRLTWPDVTGALQATYGSDAIAYFVTFSWVRGASRSDEEGTSYVSLTGDSDQDGLEDWMEALAGTITNTPAIPGGFVGTNDYYRVDPATGFTYGELYDDGDGIPTSWELKYGLDPYRYDAAGDVDDDGWSNYAEFMAGTDPTDPSDYPKPKFAATFDYHGEKTDLTSLGVYTYGQRTQGVTWGGSYDGRYTSTKGFTDGIVLGSDGTVTLDENSDIGAEGTFAVNKLAHGLVESGSIDVYVVGPDGATEIRSFQMTQANSGVGVFTQDEMGWILIALESGRVFSTGDYVGLQATVSTMVKTYAFPITFTGLVRNPEGNHTHMVEGPNRFFGWMDLDGNEAYDEGEPAGLGLHAPTLVGWDSTSVEIPLTDSLWDYPRISWGTQTSTNAAYDFSPTHYIVTFRYAGKETSESTTNDETSVSYGVVYGDNDGDGLDGWQEAQAETGLNDAFSADPTKARLDFDVVGPDGLTYGERWDDGDLMPAEWEIPNLLDSDRYDADLDKDDDGWSNYEEYLAQTWPGVARSFPMPVMELKFLYAGEVVTNTVLTAQTYSERKQGTYLDNVRTAELEMGQGTVASNIYMGGWYDGRYTTAVPYSSQANVSEAGGTDYSPGSAFMVCDGVLGEDGVQTIQNIEFAVSYIPHSQVVQWQSTQPQGRTPSITLQIVNEQGSVMAEGVLGPFISSGSAASTAISALNEEIGSFLFGNTFRGFSGSTNATPSGTVVDQILYYDPETHVLLPENVYEVVLDGKTRYISRDTDTAVWVYGNIQNKPYPSDELNPFTGWIFFKYETGAILSLGEFATGYRYRVLSHQTDGFVFPVTVGAWYRDDGTPNPIASWYQSDNGAHTHVAGGFNRILGFSDINVNGRWDPGEPMGLSLYNSVLAGPDSFTATIPLTDEMFGFPRIAWPASTNENVTSYTVNIINGAGRSVVGTGGITVEAPRTFIHEGDYIQAGLRGIDFGGTTEDNFRYTVTANIGLLKNAETLASGYVLQALKPNSGVRRTLEAIAPISTSTVHGSLVEFLWKMDWRTEGVFFTVVDDATGQPVPGLNNLYVPFPVRHNKVTDDDYYFSYIPQLENGRGIIPLKSGVYRYTIKENIRSTAVQAQSISSRFTIVNEEDDSRVRAAIKGHIHYYGRLPEEYVPGKVVVQAYKVSNRARTSLSVGGSPVARATVAEDGSFELHGLEAGTYGVIGWVDDDGDGIYRPEDTKGFGFLGGSASPIQVPAWCLPLVITNTPDFAACDLEDVHVVLRDRDTDSDGIPNGAGFPTGGSRDSRLAALKAMPVRTFPATIPAGFDWITLSLFSTNKPVTTRTTTIDYNGGKDYVTKDFVVKAPRRFLHEGDLVAGGLYGFDLGDTNVIDVSWSVLATDGRYLASFESGAFSVWTPYITNSVPAANWTEWVKTHPESVDYRRPMKARWPTQMTVVRGSVVDFEWEMDEHTAGVTFKIDGITDPSFSTNVVVPFPVLHWDPSVKCYYYKAKPQMEDGLRLLSLPDGAYRYTITERTRSNMVPRQSITETFQILNDENSRITGSIAGDIWYFGRSMEAGDPPTWASDLHLQAYKVSDAGTSSASVGGELVADSVRNTNGAFRIAGLKAGTYSIFAFVDANGNGVADEWETQGFGVFGGNASPVVVAATAVPIIVTNGASVTQVNVVLHDRDTDGDRLPDGWEWEQAGTLSELNGFDNDGGYTALPEPGPEVLTNWIWKAVNITTRTVDIPVMDGIKVRVDAPRNYLHEGDFLTPWIWKNARRGERMEGAYVEDGSLPDNVLPYLFEKKEVDGVQQWVPSGKPYYGFDLGSYTNCAVSWSVEVWDGSESIPITNGQFRIVSVIGNERRPLVAKYPTQSTKIHGKTVEFEWQMDDHNAGVEFSLWKIGEIGAMLPAGEREVVEWPEAEWIQVITNMVVAFPVRHGLAGADMTYYTAVPQLDDGLQKDQNWTPNIGKVPIQLPVYNPDGTLATEDGLYLYEIKERPRIGVIPGTFGGPLSFRERFQIDNTSTNRGLYSASGTIRYYGKVMDPREVGVTFEPDTENPKMWKASIPAGTESTPGAMSVMVKVGEDVREVFNDSAANGILYAVGGTNNLAWSGDIEYPTSTEDGSARVLFTDDQIPGIPVLAIKEFQAPLYLQVYKLADQAQTCTSIAGVPIQQIKRNPNVKGLFTVSNLEQGKYAIRAFLDSNGNGFCDDWETQGLAVQTGTVSPNIDAAAAPIEVGGSANNVSGLMIVLHDRDTDNDLLPDAWEWWKCDGTLLVSGYDSFSPGGLPLFQEYADGVLDSDPRTPDTDLDGLTDAMEILVTGTDTHLRDTDGDGVGDLEEFLAGSDPLDPASKAHYAIPALAFDADGVPYVDIAYPALRPGVVLTYELQRKLSLGGDEVWETVAEHDVANTDGTVLYSAADGVNDHASLPGTARMWPADQAEGVDFTAGFYRVKIYADYGKMVDNGDGTWSYWTWVKTSASGYEFKEAARGDGTLVRDAQGNWRFVDPDTKKSSGSLYRDPDGDWKFVK